MAEVFDIVIIGAGPGGYTAAFRASQCGAKVAVIERDRLGGVCLNWGCIPTKALIENVKTIKKAQEILEQVDPLPISLEKMLAKKDKVVNNLRKGLETLFKSYNIKLLQGQARISGANEVLVENAAGEKLVLTAKNIIIATGSRATTLKDIPLDGHKSITSDQVFSLERAPERMLIIGGGAIGCEFAQIFHYLGTQVHLVELAGQILPESDEEIVKLLTLNMVRSGIKLYTGTSVKTVVGSPRGFKVTLGEDTSLEVDCLVSAVGRRANIEDLGLAEAGIAVERGRIKVNETLETSVPGIYAIGDCVAGPMLAHKASYDAVTAVANMLQPAGTGINYSAIPKCIFTSPEIGSVGLTEKEAAVRPGIKIGKFPFAASGKAQAIGETRGMVKIIADGETGRILGAHIIGPQATELIASLALAIQNNLTVDNFIATIVAHPTLSEAVKEAMEDIHGKALSIFKKR